MNHHHGNVISKCLAKFVTKDVKDDYPDRCHLFHTMVAMWTNFSRFIATYPNIDVDKEEVEPTHDIPDVIEKILEDVCVEKAENNQAG